ncbi:PREDICTED: transcription elongation factor A protein 1-like isoform X3 [Priapulus caudatus]|uniref:Transcription elongation factor n=1 Tax=Priapulus caudatus TaxID=37621 RepID=A0ABM1EGC3_PRICU|nr:PREDICTED: transcription elongation factor A protein 1-like isoform X3 [Priapulus caudatus]
MGCEEEVLRVGKKLEKMVAKKNTEGALDLLKALQNMPITLEVLQKTRIGMSVNSLRKQSKDEDVGTLAKALIKVWKKLLSGSNQQPANYSLPTSVSTTSLTSLAKESNGRDTDVADSKDNNGASNAEKAQCSFRADNIQATNDSLRLKCREMITMALKSDPQPESVVYAHEDLAAQIEDIIFKEFGNTDMKYKTRVRSRVANLKDPKNPMLKERVLVGMIEPERIAVMSSEEMASDDLKDLRKKLTKEAINDHQMSVQGGTETDLFKCGRCRKTRCTYNQVQTRSADEPMTTFVFCLECGHRWKFC